MAEGVEVEGLEEVMGNFQALEMAARRGLGDAAEAGGEEMVELAMQLAPGPYIVMGRVRQRGDTAETAVGPDRDHWYYVFFEMGATEHEIAGNPLVFEGDNGLVITGGVRHPGMAAQPFLRPVLHEDSPAEAAGEAFWEAISGVGG